MRSVYGELHVRASMSAGIQNKSSNQKEPTKRKQGAKYIEDALPRAKGGKKISVKFGGSGYFKYLQS